MGESLEALLRELVAVDSVSARSNVVVIDLLEAKLAALGFGSRRFAYRDAAGVDKVNLVARAGPAREGGLALVGHTDTVPFDPAWSEALALTRRDGALYGRGACDTKGFIACALAAAARIDLRGLRDPLWLAFTADEEVGCLGAKELLRVGALRPRHAIVGEPTRLQPIRAGKGYCVAEVRVRGIAGHSAYPARGVSAIAGAAELLRGIEALATALAARPDPAFDPPHTTLNVGVIEGGQAKNVIPESCRFTLEWRPLPADDRDEVPARVRELGRRLEAERPGLSVTVAVSRADPGVDTEAGAPLVRFLEEQSGQPAGTVAFGTEAPELSQLGADAVVFGPGDIRVAHRTGEHVPEADLERCAEILRAAIERFCG
ncbi:MAG: acetylornithine deacetylase [Myxococcales bacterium]